MNYFIIVLNRLKIIVVFIYIFIKIILSTEGGIVAIINIILNINLFKIFRQCV